MDASSRLEPGTVIGGDYRVVRALARGGMGSVYVVEQLSTGRERALKLLHASLLERDGMRRRFEQEARIGARIKSDHVVEVLAAGVEADSGTPWLVMELLEGEDLASHLARTGPLSLAAMGEIVAQICHALGAAHAAGVVHRDLKPENVFLATSHRLGTSFTVKVLDFGIAKVIAEAQAGTTDAVGTPLYMAPEQTSSGQSIGPPADVWALGLIVFQMLTGRSYWKGGSGSGSSAMAVLREVVIEPLVPASERATALGVGDGLPDGFDAWFARAVAREPSERYANATDAFRALSALGLDTALAHAPTAAGGEDLALAATVGIEKLEQLEARQPSALTPAAVSSDDDRDSARPAPPKRTTLWLAVAGIGAAAVGGWYWRSKSVAPSTPLPSSMTVSGGPAVAPSAEALADPPLRARGPMLHICGADQGKGEDRERCNDPSFPWCDANGRYVACCGKSLVPTGRSGVCECAPGGADGNAAPGCPRAIGPQGLPMELVRGIIRAATPAMRECYRKELEANAALEGHIGLALEVTPWGDVFEARIRESSMPSSAAQECVLTVARELRFPALQGGGVLKISYPIRFTLDDEAPPQP
ncbi:MAG: protein kinase [Polyangiaceae bacterium]